MVNVKYLSKIYYIFRVQLHFPNKNHEDFSCRKFREFIEERSFLNTKKHSRVYRSSIRDSNGVQTSFRVRKIDESLEPAPNYLSIVLRATGKEGNPVDKNVALERGHRIEINVS